MSAVFVARTPAQARLLQDPAYVAVLGCLMGGQASATEVARRTSQTTKQAHHKLTRLLGAELIVVGGERPRAGRAVKLYAALADEYRVPFALTDAATIGELIQDAHRPLLEAHYRMVERLTLPGRDLRIFQGERGRMEMTLDERDEPELPVTQSVFLGYRLSEQTARELQTRLQELAQWLAAESVNADEAGTDYLLGLLLAPGRW